MMIKNNIISIIVHIILSILMLIVVQIGYQVHHHFYIWAEQLVVIVSCILITCIICGIYFWVGKQFFVMPNTRKKYVLSILALPVCILAIISLSHGEAGILVSANMPMFPLFMLIYAFFTTYLSVNSTLVAYVISVIFAFVPSIFFTLGVKTSSINNK